MCDARSTYGSHPPVVLCTDRLSPSITYRPFAEPIGTTPFLVWWCDRFATDHRSDLYVLCHTSADERAISPIVGDRANVIRVDSGTKLKAFAKAAHLVGADHVAFVCHGYTFAPRGLLHRAFEHHVRQANAYTPIHGFPLGTVPEIYQTSCLMELAALTLPGLPSDPVEIIRRLTAIATTCGDSPYTAPRAVPFQPVATSAATPGRLPEAVTVSTPRDVELVRRVVACAGSRHGFEELEHWRRCAIQMRRELHGDVQRALSTAGLTFSGRSSTDTQIRRKVLFISEPAGFSGGEESLCQLVDHLDRDAFDVHVLVGGEGHFAERLRSSGVNVLAAPCGFGAHGVDRFLYTLAKVVEVEPDVVHFNGSADPPTLYAVVVTHVPFLAHARNGLLTDDVDVFRLASRVIAVSEFMKKRVLRLDVPEERVAVVYDEVDPEVFVPTAYDRGEVRTHYGVPADAKVALMIARLVPNKRHDLLLEAALTAKARIPQLHLVLKADVFHEADTPDRLNEYIDAHAMRPWITLVPFVDDIRKMHCLADVLVLCSDDEALGRCVVEAMAMELPPIVSDSGGTHEIVRHRETGFVFSGGDAGSLRACLVAALSDDHGRRHLGRAARRYAVNHLTARRSAAEVMALYEQAILAHQTVAAR